MFEIDKSDSNPFAYATKETGGVGNASSDIISIMSCLPSVNGIL